MSLFALLLSAALGGEPTSAEPPLRFEPVEVQGMGKPQRASGKSLNAALDAVHALRPRHGPSAVLRLRVAEPAAAEGDSVPPRLRLLPKDENLDPIELSADAERRFDPAALPRALLRDGDVLLNRAAGKARLLPEVRTPGQPPRQVRLGDFRLECAALWALFSDQVPWLMRTAFAAAGGACKSARISIFMPLPEKVVRLEIVEGERRQALELESKGHAARLPVYDSSWSDDALVIWQAP